MLNIPERFEQELYDSLPEGKKVLLFGVGGGFDIVSCLPLYYTLRMKGYDVELANYSLVDFSLFPALAEPYAMNDFVVGANALVKGAVDHFPEGNLSAWFKKMYNEDVAVWMFRLQSVPQLVKNLNLFVQNKNIGTIILCGSGMRSIMVGDEEGCGEMLYPTAVLAAMKQIEVRSFIFTLGVNTSGGKRAESLYSAMENLQGLILDKAYYGGCVLEKSMDCFQYYKSAYDFISDQPGHQKSPAHEIIITSVIGGFGDHKEYRCFVCPVMSQGHFFEAMIVANYNIVIPHIETLPDYDEMVQIGLRIIQNTNRRQREVVPA